MVLAADMPEMDDEQSGRYAQLQTLLNQERQKSEQVFFLFGGGSIGPSAMSRFDRGSHIIDILNTLEPDVMGITKREFSYFQDELSLRAYEAAFPLVASNSIDVRTSLPIDGLVNTALIRKGNMQLGFISVLNQRVISEYLLPDLQIQLPKDTIIRLSQSLRDNGAQFIVLHYSFPFGFVESLLANNTIDLAFLSDTRVQQKYHFSDDQPSNLLSVDTSGHVIVAKVRQEEGGYHSDVTKIVLASLPADTKLQQQVDGYRARLDRLLNNQIGTWMKPVSTLRRDVRSAENAFANYVTDTMRSYANADIAIINGGSIRGDTTYSAGQNITRREIANELPFRSYLSVVAVPGSHIRAMLEQGLSQVENLKGGFPHIAGMKVVYDDSRPVGTRLVSVTVNGDRLNDARTYQLATTDYLATGGDNYPTLVEQDKLRVFELLVSDVVTDSIASQVQINAEVQGRLINVSDSGK